MFKFNFDIEFDEKSEHHIDSGNNRPKLEAKELAFNHKEVMDLSLSFADISRWVKG